MKILTAKVAIMGDSEAGKSELIRRITGRSFKEECGPTIGADFTISEHAAGDQEVHLYIWDLYGLPSFSLLRGYYLHGASIYAIVIDASDPGSIGRAAEWKAEVDKAKANAIGMLVATKLDLAPNREVAEQSIGEAALRLGLEAVFLPSRMGEGRDDFSAELVRAAITHASLGSPTSPELPA